MKKTFLMKCVALVAFMVMAAFSAGAQNVSITGVVEDSQSYPVIGAGVMVSGTTQGVVTDVDGKFEITVPAAATIRVEALGFKPYEFKVVAGQIRYNVVLAEESTELDDAVVIGYGTQKKKLVTGSTVNVSGDMIQKQNTTNALGALYSSVPGVSITQGTGQPWDEYKITVRGLNTTGNSNPLYVIDGVAGGSISDLNPADIESIDILKDAASAAIYGARASAGVILVTTRQGKKDTKARVTFDATMGFQQPNLNGVHSVTGLEYMELMTRAYVDNGTVLPDGEKYIDIVNPDLFPVQYQWMQKGTWNGTDWLKESINKNAPTRNFVVGISGGNDVSRYSVSISKSYVEGTLGYPMVTFFDRTTIRANSDFSLIRRGDRDVLKVGENATFFITDSNGVRTMGLFDNTIHDYLTLSPLLPAYDLDGSLYTYDKRVRDGWQQNESMTNLLEKASLTTREGKSYGVQGNVYAEFAPIKELKIRTAYGYRLRANFSRSYTPAYKLSGSSMEPYDEVSQNARVRNSWSWETTANYKKTFAADHTVDILAGASIEGTGWGMGVGGKRKQTKFGTWESANLTLCESDIVASMIEISGDNTIPYNDIVSFFGRANYSYKDKYLASIIFREDGSSNFAKGHRWGFFPSASVGWVLSEEDFMDWSKGVLDFWKFRGAWGRNGNCSVDNFQYAATVKLDGAYDFTGTGTSVSTASYPSIIPNPDLTWETTEQWDLGFDSRFFRSRLGVTFDWYLKDTKDWLVKSPILSTYGAEAPTINGGAVRNQGVELSFTWNDRIGDLTYSVGLNGSYNHNEILYINNADGIIHGRTNVIAYNLSAYNTYEARPGKPIGYFTGIASEGIFQNQAQIDEYNKNGYAFIDGYDKAKPGDVIWVDQNKDGNYDTEDVVEIGNPHPDFNLGLNISLQYKGFDFSLTGSGAFGQQVLQSYRSFSGEETHNYTNNFVNRCWTGEGSTNSFPRFSHGKSNNLWCKGYVGDIWAQDADFFKIRNITLGYDFKHIFKSLPIESLRLFITGQNLITFTKYDGMDPEVGYGDGVSWTSGIDIGYYPAPKTYLAGVSIKF